MSKRQLIVYNSNKPKELFTCIRVDETGSVLPKISSAEYAIIEATCQNGPYLAFFRDSPDAFYTFSLCNEAYTQKLEEKDCWFNLNLTCLAYDPKQQEIVSSLLRKLCEIELGAQAAKKGDKPKRAPDKDGSEKTK